MKRARVALLAFLVVVSVGTVVGRGSPPVSSAGGAAEPGLAAEARVEPSGLYAGDQ